MLGPYEADSPLIVDSDAVLILAVIFELLQSVGWRYAQVIKRLRLVEHEQLAQRNLLNLPRQAARYFTLPDFFGFFAKKINDYAFTIMHGVI
jgi:hypothetical protein